MPPQARRMCSSCVMFMRELPVDLPALPRYEDAAERVALTETASLFSRIQQEKTNRFPFAFQDAAPFRYCRRWSLKLPPSARGPRALEAGPGGIPVNGIHNSARERKAPSIDLLMGLHGSKCSTPEGSTQSVDRSPCPGHDNRRLPRPRVRPQPTPWHPSEHDPARGDPSCWARGWRCALGDR